MTKEEAKKEIIEMTNALQLIPNTPKGKAVSMALRALEQESIIDKIRDEIMDFEEELFHRPNTDYSDYAAVRHCVEIIDKYKTETVN